MEQVPEDELRSGRISLPDWPADGLEEQKECPTCGRGERTLMYTELRDVVFGCAPGKWSLYECSSCRSAYLDPRPTASTIHLAYERYYTHTPDRVEDESRLGWLRGLVRGCANDYRNRRFGSRLRPAITGAGAVLRLIPLLTEYIEKEYRFIPSRPEGGLLVDTGCGDGRFLEKASRLGWSAFGVDSDAVAVARARERGLRVEHGSIEDLVGRIKPVDAITMIHVIEHVHDPTSTLDAAASLLKSEGHLILETPNNLGPAHRRFGRHWRGLEVPRHLTIFSWGAIEQLLDQSGFDIVRRVNRLDTYPKNAAASLALKDGRDPYGAISWRIRDWAISIFLRVCWLVSEDASEYITVVARKRATDG